MDVMALRRNIVTGNHRLPFRERTVIGNPVSFRTNADKPLNELLIPFLPIQQGTGDPSPSNVRPIIGWTGLTAWRTGKNLIPNGNDTSKGYVANRFLNYNGTLSASSTNYYVSEYFRVAPGTNYVWGLGSGISATEKNKPSMCFYDANKDFIIGIQMSYIVSHPGVVPENAVYARSSQAKNPLSTVPFIFEYGTEATPYEEFVALDSYLVTFPAVGKNLLSGMETGAINQSTGQDETDNTVMRSAGFIPVEPGETYTLGTLASSGNIRFYGYDEDKDYLGNAVVRNVTNATYTVGTNTHFIRFQGAAERFTGVDLQFEKGESHTAYEPYTNIVYGGTPNVVNGVLTVEWVFANLNSESAWGSYGTGDGFLVYVRKSDMQVGNRLPGYCDMFPSTYSATGANIRFGADDNVIRIYNINQFGITDLSEWKEFIGTDGINVCYPLATPIEILIDPITVQTLIGDNTIWSDTNASNTVKYLKRG